MTFSTGSDSGCSAAMHVPDFVDRDFAGKRKNAKRTFLSLAKLDLKSKISHGDGEKALVFVFKRLMSFV
jgi:hypothetical protein